MTEKNIVNKSNLENKERVLVVNSEALDAKCQHCQEVYPEFEVSNCAKCRRIICDDDLYSIDLGNGDCSEEEYCSPCFDRVMFLQTKQGKEQLETDIDYKIRELQIEVDSIEIKNKQAMTSEGKTQINYYNSIAERLNESQKLLNEPQKGLLDLLKEKQWIKENKK